MLLGQGPAGPVAYWFPTPSIRWTGTGTGERYPTHGAGH